MGGVPSYSNVKAQSRMKQSAYIERNKDDSTWAKKLESNKYPACVGKNLFDDCPTEISDTVPSTCKSCPQYIPTIDERREKMRKLMEEMKKDKK